VLLSQREARPHRQTQIAAWRENRTLLLSLRGREKAREFYSLLLSLSLEREAQRERESILFSLAF